MKEQSPQEFNEKNVDRLIESYGKKPSEDVLKRLNKTLSAQKKKFLEKEKSNEKNKTKAKER